MSIKSTLLFLFISSFVIKPSLINAQAVNVQDSLALVDLYNSTDGPNWTNNYNWLTSAPVSLWAKIKVKNGRVVEINLQINNLEGYIPSSIGDLTSLESLYLYHNKLSGIIPPEIGNLKKLSNLYLNENKLTGKIPPEIGNLSKLKLLWLFLNELSGSIPSELGNLENLEELSLGVNQLTGNIPPQIGNLRHLEILYLYYNQLSGNIPRELGRLKVFLALNNNNLSGNIPPEISFHSKGNIADNYFTFNGMEPFAQNNYNYYSPQAIIPIHQNNNYLYVSADGTLSNNTYKWFMVGAPDSTIITGDSVFYPSQNGKYYAIVTNSICTKLTLYTDTIEYSSVLPVTIVNLKAQQQGNIIKVDWSSLTEINVGSYEIQRSLNGRDFSTIGSVVAKNNGTSQTSYTFNDLKPAIGNNYYKVKVTDEDGQKTYSNIVSVNVNSDKTITLVYPVPARDVLHIQTNGNASFSLIDQSGKILLMQNINGNGTINISGITNGFYYLKNNTNSTLQKVIISR